MSYPPRRVVVTGMGCITALGRTSPETFSALMAGKCARGDISCFATEDCRTRHGAQVDLSEPWNGISARRWEALPRASRLALIAVGEALAHADLLNDRGRCKMSRLEIAASSTAGGMPCGETFLRERLPSKDGAPRTEQGTGDIRNLTHYQPQSQIADIHRHFGFGGPFFIVANACASGANAIGHAWQLIRRGDADIILAGGFEALARLVFTGFDSLQSLSPDLCRPFDTARNGLMLGEGAAFLVLESEAHARARGARLLAEIAGYGQSTDLGHTTQPDRQGLPIQSALAEAFATASTGPGGSPARRDVGYLNAHGTGTPLNDGAEAEGIRTFFAGGDAPAAWPGCLRISSTKAALGHTLGAAGCVEAVVTLEALLRQQLPPQLHLSTPEPAVAGALAGPGQPVPSQAFSAAVCVNLGFGGSNAALLFRAMPADHAAASPQSASPAESTTSSALAVYGVGAVSPAGIGAQALMRTTEPPEVTGMAPLFAEAPRSYPVLRVDTKSAELAAIAKHPRLRRASPLALYMAEAARQAVEAVPAAAAHPSRLGIISLYWTGSIQYSSRFYQQGWTQGARFAMPALFPETVFNVPTSHVAAMLGVSRWCYSLVGDEASVVTGLRTAAAWLGDGGVDYVLLVGAEELDPIAVQAYACLGWLRPMTEHSAGASHRFVASEGAGALLLGRPANSATHTQPSDPQALAHLSAFREGPGFRSRAEAKAALEEVLGAHRPDTEIRWDDRRATWFAPLERQHFMDGGDDASSTQARTLGYPRYIPLGEAFTASAMWQLIRTSLCPGLTASATVPFFGHNSQISSCQVSRDRT